MASPPPPSPDVLTLHLRAGTASFDLQVPVPAVRSRAVVRVAGLDAYPIQATYRWTGTSWEPQ